MAPRPAEYAPSRHDETAEPDAKPVGFSAFTFGRQRFGDAESRCGDFAPAGDEGRVALDLLRRDGAFSSHEHFDRVDVAVPDGSEAMPLDGFQTGRAVRVNERSR